MQSDMMFYQIKLNFIGNLDTLERMKRQLQNEVTDSRLNWQQRMLIYRKVELVIERIRAVAMYRKRPSA